MSELDELVALKGVLMAGRFGPDWQVAEHKYTSLFYAEAIGVMGSFCSTIQMMFNTMESPWGVSPHQPGYPFTAGWSPEVTIRSTCTVTDSSWCRLSMSPA